jgi:hypothetical protein
MTKRKTIKDYQNEDKVRSLRMLAARKRKAAERHEATAAQFRAEALELDAERARVMERQEQAS